MYRTSRPDCIGYPRSPHWSLFQKMDLALVELAPEYHLLKNTHSVALMPPFPQNTHLVTRHFQAHCTYCLEESLNLQ